MLSATDLPAVEFRTFLSAFNVAFAMVFELFFAVSLFDFIPFAKVFTVDFPASEAGVLSASLIAFPISVAVAIKAAFSSLPFSANFDKADVKPSILAPPAYAYEEITWSAIVSGNFKESANCWLNSDTCSGVMPKNAFT